MIESPETRLLTALQALIQYNVDLTIEMINFGENPIESLERLKVMNEASFGIAGLNPPVPPQGNGQAVSDLH